MTLGFRIFYSAYNDRSPNQGEIPMRFHICFNASKSVVILGSAALVLATMAKTVDSAFSYMAQKERTDRMKHTAKV